MSILNESQLDRDKELAKLCNKSLKEIEDLVIASPDSIRVYNKEIPPIDYTALYRGYKYLNLIAYFKTLMNRSAKSRHPELFKLLRETKNKVCLDFGSGVGTHSIALMENGNNVTLLDVEGSELLHFAMHRLMARGFMDYSVLFHNEEIPRNKYDIVICTDVLEHVAHPIRELSRIKDSMKVSGILHLQVSKMVKPSSGHFKDSIEIWNIAGVSCLKKYFEKVGATLWKKK